MFRRRAMTVSVIAALMFTVMSASPALADCVMAEAWYSTDGGTTKHYVVGPDHCVAPTSWPLLTYPKVTVPVNDVWLGFGVGIPLP